MTDSTSVRLRFLVATLAGWTALGLQIRRALPFLADDTLISLRYSRRFLEGDGLTFTDGERVEGYTNLLLVLASAGLGALGLDLVTAARLVCGLGAMAAIAAVAAYGARQGFASAVLGAVLLGACPGLGVWVSGGLEQPLLVGLVAGAWVLSLHADQGDVKLAWAAGLLFALGCLTRPDTPLFVVLAAIWGLWRGWRTALALAAPGAVVYLAHLAFRLGYYGDYVPNTAHAKLAFTWHRVETGSTYVWEGIWPLTLFLLCAAVGAYRAEPRVRALLLPPLVCWLLYVVIIGGDVFTARRHLLVVLPALALLATHAVRGMNLGWAPVALGLAVGNAFAADAFDRTYQVARNERMVHRCEPMATAFRDRFGSMDPLVATVAAGCWPYYSELDSLDTLGLNDAHIAKHPPPTHGLGHLGHDLGDGAYVLSREPDFVLFRSYVGSIEPGYIGDRQLARLPGFKRDYRVVRFRARGAEALVYVRIPSEKVGIQPIVGGFYVPPWLFGGTDDNAKVYMRENRPIHVALQPSRSTSLRVPLPAGTWRVKTRGRGPHEVELKGGEELGNRTVRLQQASPVDIRITAGGKAFLLEGVEIVEQR